MIRNRWRWWIGCSMLCLAGLGAFLLYEALNRCPVRYENFENIREGMTKDEVAALLGCRHGDYSTGTVHGKWPLPDGSLSYQPMTLDDMERTDRESRPLELWLGDRGLIAVSYGADQKVLHKKFLRGRRLPPAWWLFLERRLGLD